MYKSYKTSTHLKLENYLFEKDDMNQFYKKLSRSIATDNFKPYKDSDLWKRIHFW